LYNKCNLTFVFISG